MVVGMAAQAFIIQAKPGILFGFKFLTCYVPGVVAIRAFPCRMSSCQGVSGKRMIEVFGIEIYEFSILPVMFTVAGETGIFLYLCGCVIAFPCSYSGLDLSMTGQAFCI
jgi:hypothetical protein